MPNVWYEVRPGGAAKLSIDEGNKLMETVRAYRA